MSEGAFTRDDMVRALVRQGATLSRAEAVVTKKLGPAPLAIEVNIDALEKQIEHEGDNLMRALGFEVVRFSHPGRTKQTPGIADRRYYHRARRLSCWWEAKSATGRQRPDQRVFQEMVEACGESYVLGTHVELLAWLLEQHVISGLTPEGLPIPNPIDGAA